MVAIRADQVRVYPKYLFAVLRSQLIQDRIARLHVGTLIPHFKKGDFDKLTIPIPNRSDQIFIGDTYFNISARIDVNRRMSATQEAMARALFKSWFVDFDPVRAKAEGRDTRLPLEIEELFPDRFVDSELGQIPEGWVVSNFGEVAKQYRRAIRPEEIESSMPYIGLEHMPKHSIALADWASAEEIASNKYEFRKGEILFGKLRTYFHKVGIAPVDGVCSTDIVVVAPKNSVWFGFVLGHASSVEFVDYTHSGSTGTKMPRTNWRYMARYVIALSPESLAAEFARMMQPSFDRIVTAQHESRDLADLRDTLLSKLVSGELQVKDAEEILRWSV